MKRDRFVPAADAGGGANFLDGQRTDSVGETCGFRHAEPALQCCDETSGETVACAGCVDGGDIETGQVFTVGPATPRPEFDDDVCGAGIAEAAGCGFGLAVA